MCLSETVQGAEEVSKELLDQAQERYAKGDIKTAKRLETVAQSLLTPLKPKVDEPVIENPDRIFK